MTNFRQAAYQIDPALWVREVLGVTPTAGRRRSRAARRVYPSADRPPGRQDHDRGLGDCTRHAVYAGVVVGDCLSGAAPERRSSAPRPRHRAQDRRQACQRQCLCARTGIMRAGPLLFHVIFDRFNRIRQIKRIMFCLPGLDEDNEHIKPIARRRIALRVHLVLRSP